MERNHIIGFLLIFGLLVLWMFVNSPSKEEVARMQERQDSLNRIEIIKDSITEQVVDTSSVPVIIDSVGLQGKYGTFASAASGSSRTVRLENEEFIIDFDTKGGRISGVELKNYKKVLLDEKKKEYK